ncbi:MAG: FkbM family methyltransferase [Patescibacteria group bacterium]|nr:FkbM family methyltransferase [Patescibacteria group bacterium]
MIKKLFELLKKIIRVSIARTKTRIYEIIGIKSFFKVYEGHDALLNYLRPGKRGFFVECGGNNGKNADPTYYLEKIMKWRGVIVEPLPIYRRCARTRRKSKVYNCALVAGDFPDKTIPLIDCNLMSVIKGVVGYEDWARAGEKAQKIKAKEIVVPASTLNEILEDYFSIRAPRRINLLVIDVEGYEINVLKGFDLDKYRPEKILIEIQEQSRKQFIDDYLQGSYKFIAKMGHADYLYESKIA